jgi:hypothetical protein
MKDGRFQRAEIDERGFVAADPDASTSTATIKRKAAPSSGNRRKKLPRYLKADSRKTSMVQWVEVQFMRLCRMHRAFELYIKNSVFGSG